MTAQGKQVKMETLKVEVCPRGVTKKRQQANVSISMRYSFTIEESWRPIPGPEQAHSLPKTVPHQPTSPTTPLLAYSTTPALMDGGRYSSFEEHGQ